jgi:hypothetical protein
LECIRKKLKKKLNYCMEIIMYKNLKKIDKIFEK